MQCKIITPAPWLQPQFSVCIRNLIALVKNEPNASNDCIPTELRSKLAQNRDTLLSSINDCLPLVRKVDSTSTEYLLLHDDYELVEQMWKKFESNKYDCINIFFKIVRCYYDTIDNDTHHTKNVPTESQKEELEDILQTILSAFSYLKKPENIIELVDKNAPNPYGISKDSPEYSTIFDENGNFIHKEYDVFYDRDEYQKFLQQMAIICSKIQNNIHYKCSETYALRKNILYTGTRQEKDFKDKSLIMIKKLYVLFNNMFGLSYTKYIRAITNILFPDKKRYVEQVNEILRPQSGSKTELKKLEKKKKDIEKMQKKFNLRKNNIL